MKKFIKICFIIFILITLFVFAYGLPWDRSTAVKTAIILLNTQNLDYYHADKVTFVFFENKYIIRANALHENISKKVAVYPTKRNKYGLFDKIIMIKD
jgi:hypothetical protein